MPKMNHQDAHELIATLRYAVNESFEKNQKLSNFDPEAHNLCIAHCTFNNAPPLNLFSFSAMSSFSKTALNKLVHEWGVEFVPTWRPISAPSPAAAWASSTPSPG